jgi:hypothetical protein
MTLTVRAEQDDGYTKTVFNMREANGSGVGGNEIEIRNQGMYGFEITLNNDEFSVDITHKTAEKLFYALAGSSNAEYFLYKIFRDNLNRVYYKNLWTSLEKKEKE